MEAPYGRIPLEEAHTLAQRALLSRGAGPQAASATAAALVAAERDGQAGHGLQRLAPYLAQLEAGKILGAAVPVVTGGPGATAVVDAGLGFAYPALRLAERTAALRVRDTGAAAVAVVRSHHAGQAGQGVEALAHEGLVALFFSNTPAAMAFHGGRAPRLGTNPLAFAAPLPGRAPLVIDLALSQVARSKVVAAARERRPIPRGWAFDAAGLETEDPEAALAGALAPLGGPKGAALAMMVEILCAALTGAHFGWEASSFLDAEGGPPAVGHLLIVLDPSAFAGPGFLDRMGALADAATEDGARLPGDRRLQRRADAERSGLLLSAELLQQLRRLGEG